MAKDRDTFILLSSHYKMFRKRLTLEEKGHLLDAIFSDRLGEDYEQHIVNERVGMAFDAIQDFYQECDRRYEKQSQTNSENARKRYQKDINVSERMQPQATANERMLIDVNCIDVNCSDVNCSDVNCSDKRESREKKVANAPSDTKKFKIPTIEEIRSYCKERGNNIDPEQFFAFYQSKGWKVGSHQMKDWKAAVITWEKRHAEDKKRNQRPSTTRNSTFVPLTGDYSEDLKRGFHI